MKLKGIRTIALLVVAVLLVIGSVAGMIAAGDEDKSCDDGLRMDAHHGAVLADIMTADGAVTGVKFRTDVIRINPELMEAYEKLVNASPDLIAQGVPLVGFCWHVGAIDTDTGITETIVIMIGLREVNEEHIEPIKAIVEGVEGIEFDFFQARFTREEISRWQDDIVDTFLGTSPLPLGVTDVPLSGTNSSWRKQRIVVRLAGEIQPEYIAAIRTLVGNEAPLEFKSTSGRPLPRYFREMWGPHEAMEKQLWVDVFEQLFPDVDILNMRKWEVEEFFKTLTPEKWAEVGRVLLDYAVERGLLSTEERQELDQEWVEMMQETIIGR